MVKIYVLTFYKTNIVLRIIDIVSKNIIVKKSAIPRNFGILNSFLKGVNITKINPVKLLMKKLG